MATAKYKPLDIENGLIPKEWLNNPIMSYNDAEAEYQELQRKTAAADYAGFQAKDAARDDAAEEDISSKFKTKRQEKLDQGGDGELSDDEIYSMVNEAELSAGKGSSVANREILRLNKEAELELRKQKMNQPKYVSRSPYSDVYEFDPETGEETLVRPGKERPSSNPKFTPKTLLNPTTLEEIPIKSKDEELAAFDAGFTMTKPSMSNAELEYQKGKLKRANEKAGKTKNAAPPKDDEMPPDFNYKTERLQKKTVNGKTQYRVVPR